MPNVQIKDIAASRAAAASTDLMEIEDAAGNSYKVPLSILADYYGSLMHPGYLSGMWYKFGEFGVASLAVTADRVYLTPMRVRRKVTLSAAAFHVSTGATGGAALAAIYSSDPTTARWKTRLATLGGPIACTASGLSQAGNLAANVTLDVGLYWKAALFTGTPTVSGLGSADNVAADINGTDPAAFTNYTTSINGYYASLAYSGGLPADLSSLTGITANNGVAVPMPWFKVA